MGVSRSIDIAHLFKGGIFNHEQIHKVGTICKTLGQYMFLDRELLEILSKENIGLSYIDKCKKYDIITELRHETEEGKKDKFYFQLDVGGFMLLEQASLLYNNMNILADYDMKSRIITFNYYCHMTGKKISLYDKQDPFHNYFVCMGNIIAYFEKYITLVKLEEEISYSYGEVDKKNKTITPLTKKELYEKFKFSKIDTDLIDVGKKTKTTMKDR